MKNLYKIGSNFLLIIILFLPHDISAQTSLNTKFAINFPFRDPETASFNVYFKLLQDLKVKLIRQLTFGDVFWKQVEPTNNNWTFAQSDSAVANPYGITTIPTLFSMFGEDTVGYQVPWRATTSPSGGWRVIDSADTKDYLSKVINRYKNYTKYWEVGNELNAHDRKPAGFTASELVSFMRFNYRWIKEIDPEASVVIPGMLGTCGVPMNTAYTWLRSFLKAGGGNTFDIMNYHDYNSWWTLPLHLDSIKAILQEFGIQKKLWVSECSISSDNTSPITPSYSSVDEQVADTWRRPVVTFGNGLDLFYWQSLWSSGSGSEWRHFGLTDPTGKKKKSFHAYKLCLEKLDNFTSVEKISSGTINDDNNSGGNGLWVYKFTFADGSKKWVLWSTPSQIYELNGLLNTKATITSVNPTTISIDGGTVTWNITQKDVAGGKVSINLTNMPVLVEDGNYGNNAPALPTATFPAHNSTNIDYNVNLSWSCSDQDNDPLKYNILLDEFNPPRIKVASNIPANSYQPGTLKKNTAYFWKIIANDGKDSTQSQIYKFTTGLSTRTEENENLPTAFALYQSYPNPFNPVTKIRYALPKEEKVKIEVYSLIGQKIETLVDELQEAGYHEASFGNKDLSSGVYFYIMKAGDFQQTRKMILIK